MLQDLKAPDRLAELHARFQIFERGGIERLHDAHRFRAERGNAVIDGLLERCQALTGPPQYTIG